MIVVAVSRHIRDRPGAGNWKDVEGTRLTLDDLGVPYARVDFDPEAPGDLLHGHEAVTDLVLHYTWWPDAIAAVRTGRPRLRVHVRAHNAEALQHLHRTRFGPRAAYGALRLLLRDARCRHHADTILGISAWDNDRYWSRLPGRARVELVPYFCPWPRLRPRDVVAPWPTRERRVLCMPGARDPISASMIAGFARLARAAAGSEWRFLMTPGVLSTADESVPEGVERLGTEVDPWRELCAARVVAVLTPLGFGAKTTIVDALAAGCRVLVHPALHRRLGASERAACTAFDPDGASDRARAVDVLEAEPRHAWSNDECAAAARRALAAALRS